MENGTNEKRFPTLREIEEEHVVKVLTNCGGNLTEACYFLGIGRATLYRKLKTWGLTVNEFRRPKGN